MAQNHFQQEIDLIFTPEPITYSRNITMAVVQQFYNPLSQLLSVARDDANKLLAYTWASRHERAPWSDDEMIAVRMAHLDLELSTRQRVRLLTDMITLWETWAGLCGVTIICSTTMRRSQDAFLRLHEKMGYDVRGSFAYKRLSTT
jgi:hypothetical protein